MADNSSGSGFGAQTDALSHLLAMLAPQTFGGQPQAPGPVDQYGVAGGAAVSDPSKIPPAASAKPQGGLQGLESIFSGASGAPTMGGMPIMSPQAWMKQGAGNFMPGSMGVGGGVGGSIGGAGKGGGQSSGSASGVGSAMSKGGGG